MEENFIQIDGPRGEEQFYSKSFNLAEEKEPKTEEEKKEVLKVIETMINESEKDVSFESKLWYLQIYISTILSWSTKLFPTP